VAALAGQAAYVVLLTATPHSGIEESFRSLLDGRPALLISHRFANVRTADRIYLLDRGRLIESGTHDELFARDGRYAELFRMQASGYGGDDG